MHTHTLFRSPVKGGGASLVKVQGAAQLVECLLGRNKALSSISIQHVTDMLIHTQNPSTGVFRQKDNKFVVSLL